jgi:C-terminal processing protease CtpA/Prc
MKLLLVSTLFLFPFLSFAGTRITGVGIALAHPDAGFYVGSVLKDTPAARDGAIAGGDQILSLKQQGDTAWTSLDRLELADVVAQIRGAKGVPVSLHLTGAHGQYEVTLVRDTFDAP